MNISLLTVANAASTTYSKHIAMANHFLHRAHNIGLWFSIGVVAIILILALALMWDSYHDDFHFNAGTKVTFATVIILGFGFCVATENSSVNQYRANLRQATTQLVQKSKHKNMSKAKQKSIKHRIKKYKGWLELSNHSF